VLKEVSKMLVRNVKDEIYPNYFRSLQELNDRKLD